MTAIPFPHSIFEALAGQLARAGKVLFASDEEPFGISPLADTIPPSSDAEPDSDPTPVSLPQIGWFTPDE